MRFKLLYFLISALVIVPGLFSLIKWGLRPSIDFTGGTILELEFNSLAVSSESKADIQKAVNDTLEETKINNLLVQQSGSNRFLIKTQPLDRQQATKLETALGEKINNKEQPVELRFETVGPILGKELLQKTILAVVLAAGFILLWVWRQFRDPMYGICAILAMFHDLLILLGVFSLLGHFAQVEIDTLYITAILTILSFSVHDTVVVYDRIRESQKKFLAVLFEDLVDKAVSETLSRSVNNSMTIIFMLLALYLLGGSTMKWFTFALLIGTISGTYSSTFTAAPLLVVWNQLKRKK